MADEANLATLQSESTNNREELGRLNYLNMTYMQSNFFSTLSPYFKQMVVTSFQNVFTKTFPIEWKEKSGIGVRATQYDTTMFKERTTDMQEFFHATIADIDELIDAPLSKRASIERERIISLGHLRSKLPLIAQTAPVEEKDAAVRSAKNGVFKARSSTTLYKRAQMWIDKDATLFYAKTGNKSQLASYSGQVVRGGALGGKANTSATKAGLFGSKSRTSPATGNIAGDNAVSGDAYTQSFDPLYTPIRIRYKFQKSYVSKKLYATLTPEMELIFNNDPEVRKSEVVNPVASDVYRNFGMDVKVFEYKSITWVTTTPQSMPNAWDLGSNQSVRKTASASAPTLVIPCRDLSMDPTSYFPYPVLLKLGTTTTARADSGTDTFVYGIDSESTTEYETAASDMKASNLNGKTASDANVFVYNLRAYAGYTTDSTTGQITTTKADSGDLTRGVGRGSYRARVAVPASTFADVRFDPEHLIYIWDMSQVYLLTMPSLFMKKSNTRPEYLEATQELMRFAMTGFALDEDCFMLTSCFCKNVYPDT